MGLRLGLRLGVSVGWKSKATRSYKRRGKRRRGRERRAGGQGWGLRQREGRGLRWALPFSGAAADGRPPTAVSAPTSARHPAPARPPTSIRTEVKDLTDCHPHSTPFLPVPPVDGRSLSASVPSPRPKPSSLVAGAQTATDDMHMHMDLQVGALASCSRRLPLSSTMASQQLGRGVPSKSGRATHLPANAASITATIHSTAPTTAPTAAPSPSRLAPLARRLNHIPIGASTG